MAGEVGPQISTLWKTVGTCQTYYRAMLCWQIARGFNVAESVAHYGASLYIPAFTRGVDQLDPTQVEATRKIANVHVRIHVERVIGSMWQRFQILNATSVLQKELYTKKCNEVTLLDCVV